MKLTDTQRRRAKEATHAVFMPCGCPDCADGGRFAWTSHDTPPYLDYICLRALFEEDLEAYHHLCALVVRAVIAEGSEFLPSFFPPLSDYFLG
jgi:hypothetical protein